MKNIFCILIIIFACVTAQAEILPSPGKQDARVRIVDYSPMNVVRLNTFYGVSTHIQFSPTETIRDIATGDALAWQISARKNNLYIKPKAKESDTNMTVVTDQRTYHFVLIVVPLPTKSSNAWKDKNLIYSLGFRYPKEEAELRNQQLKLQKQLDQQKAENKAINQKLATATAKAGHNTNYWVAGHEEVSPTGAYDDGRFIYLTFSANRDMPAVYVADSQGNESLVNTHVMSANTIVVQRLVKNLILRRGQYVASVVNRSFDGESGQDNTTGTIAPDVERTVKEHD